MFNPKLADAYPAGASGDPPGWKPRSRDESHERGDRGPEAKPVDLANAYVLRSGLQQNNADRLADLSKALELDPTNKDAWQAKIMLQLASGKVEEAAREAESCWKMTKATPSRFR